VAFFSAASPTASSRHLFVTSVDDAAPARQISGKHPTLQGHATPPAWSIDGSRLFYAAYADGAVRLASAAVDGSGVTFLTDDAAPDPWTPFISPDGKWLAFRAQLPETTLMVMSVDGGAPRELLSVTEINDSFANLAWSSDSTRVVYHRGNPDGGKAAVVETIDIRDRTITRLSRDGEISTDPSWSPDGRWVAYGIEVDGTRHTAIVAPDGSGYRDLGTIGGCVMGWSPDAKYLFGFTTDCFSSKLMRIPIDHPSAAVEFDLPGALTGMPAWQRIAP
jgi:Tol biopolymer transport system component